MSYDPQEPARPVNYVPGGYAPSPPPAFVPAMYGQQPEPPTPPRRRAWPLVAALISLAVVVIALGVVLAWPHLKPAPKPVAPAGVSQATAQRACRTAIGDEWKSRLDGSDVKDVVAAVQSVEIQETWQTADGWSVNGTVHYTLTTGVIDPVQETLDLTCKAAGTDANPATSVDNRH